MGDSAWILGCSLLGLLSGLGISALADRLLGQRGLVAAGQNPLRPPRLWLPVAAALLFALTPLRAEPLAQSQGPLVIAIFQIGLMIEICALLLITVTDLEQRLVLNKVLAPTAGLALALAIAYPPGVVSAALGALAGFGIFVLVAVIGRGAMGAGDVKLAGVIGLLLGFPDVLRALTLGIILGGLAAAVLLLARKVKRKDPMAYAPYLVAGTLFYLLLK